MRVADRAVVVELIIGGHHARDFEMSDLQPLVVARRSNAAVAVRDLLGRAPGAIKYAGNKLADAVVSAGDITQATYLVMAIVDCGVSWVGNLLQLALKIIVIAELELPIGGVG